MGRIILARHGECEYNRKNVINGRVDTSLSQRGIAQARYLNGVLNQFQYKIGLVLSSPLRRAWQTALLATHNYGVPLVEHPLLIERCFGILEGKPYCEIPKLAKSYRETKCKRHIFAIDVEGGESMVEDLPRRAKQCLGLFDLYQRQTKMDILVVSHWALINFVLAEKRRHTWEDTFNYDEFPNAGFVLI